MSSKRLNYFFYLVLYSHDFNNLIETLLFFSSPLTRPAHIMSQHYNRFLKLLERWPVDQSKIGRDLGQYLRDQLKAVLGGTNIIAVKDERLVRQHQSLENIVNDVHLKAHPRSLNSTATGLSGEQCREVLSSEFLEYLNKEGGFEK